MIISQLIYGIDIVIFIHLSLIMIKRVICSSCPTNINKFKCLLTSREYLTDLLLMLASLIAVCKLTNHLSTLKDSTQLPDNFQWLLFINIIGIALLIKFRKSQPKLLIHFYEEILITINKLKYVTNNLFKK